MHLQTQSFHRFGLAALRRDFVLKVVLGVMCSMAFSGIFRWLQNHPRHEPLMWDWCPTWQLLPFEAAWTWPYLALFPLIGMAWLMQPGGREVARFFGAMLATALVAWTCFYLWPTGSVRPPLLAVPWCYRLVINADAPLNSIPCLHAAFSVVAAVALLGGPLQSSAGWRRATWGLVAAICVSAIALRQHTDFDVLAGLALGGAVAWGYRRSFRWFGPEESELEPAVGEIARVRVRD